MLDGFAREKTFSGGVWKSRDRKGVCFSKIFNLRASEVNSIFRFVQFLNEWLLDAGLRGLKDADTFIS